MNQIKVIRHMKDSIPVFGILTDSNNIINLHPSFTSLPKLLNSGILTKIKKGDKSLLGTEEKFLKENLISPITFPKNIIGIGYNYPEHCREVGKSKKIKRKQMIAFRKNKTSLSNPNQDIKKPLEIGLLDYEIELGLVIGKQITPDSKITSENINEFIAGYVLRDIQIRQGTLFDKSKGFRNSKSYPGFCPAGPVFLYSNNPKPDFKLIQILIRKNRYVLLQNQTTKSMTNSPLEILVELQKRLSSENPKNYRCFVNLIGKRNYSLEPGDLILTGTPKGVALDFSLIKLFLRGGKEKFINYEQKNNPLYLNPGDVLISYSKGLGSQKHKIIN